jgi:hypothetical protein
MGDVTGRKLDEGDANLTEGVVDSDNGAIDLVDVPAYNDHMAYPNNVADVLKAKIRQLEEQALELQGAVSRLTTVNMNLSALRQTLALIETENTSAQNGNMPPSPSPPSGPPIPAHLSRIVPGSIGATIIEVLQQAGRPMRADEILMAVRQKGKAEVAQPTLASTLSTYVSTGKLKRTAPGMYALI